MHAPASVGLYTRRLQYWGRIRSTQGTLDFAHITSNRLLPLTKPAACLPPMGVDMAALSPHDSLDCTAGNPFTSTTIPKPSTTL
jgi:hypothetical protein